MMDGNCNKIYVYPFVETKLFKGQKNVMMVIQYNTMVVMNVNISVFNFVKSVNMVIVQLVKMDIHSIIIICVSKIVKKKYLFHIMKKNAIKINYNGLIPVQNAFKYIYVNLDA